MSLKFFQVDYSRVENVAELEFYQIGLAQLMKMKGIGFDILNPSWTKTVEDPIRAKGFFTNMLEAMFLGKHGLDSLNIDEQIKMSNRNHKVPIRVAMMFLPGSTKVKNQNLSMMVKIARDALPGFVVLEVSGNTTSGREVEEKVKYAIEQAKAEEKSVLILSAGMAQRSFSIPEITELYLAFDGGDSAAVIQKMSRALTQWMEGKVARIFSLSFNPNRDDTFDALIIQTAINYQKKHSNLTLKDALKDVLKTFNIFDCETQIRFELDCYLNKLLERNSISRYVGKTADFSKLSHVEISELINGNVENGNGNLEVAPAGKTHKPEVKSTSEKKTNERKNSDEKKAREVIENIIRHIGQIFLATNTSNIEVMFETLQKNSELSNDIAKEFNVSMRTIENLFEKGIINKNTIELLI